MNTFIYIIIAAFLGWLIWTYIGNNSTVSIMTAFAGSPSRTVPKVLEFQTPKRKVVSFIDDERVDVSKLIKIVIKGHSLEKAGIYDNALVYVSEWDKSTHNLQDLIGRFIILNIDNERTMAEHPTKADFFRSEGKKARKVLRIVPVSLGDAELHELCDEMLVDEGDSEKDRLKKEILDKYGFASKYYSKKGETKLIMSLTYRNDGKDLGFSFHSEKWLFGTVEYVNNTPHLSKAS